MRNAKLVIPVLVLLAVLIGVGITTAQDAPDSTCIRSCTQTLAQDVRECKGDRSCIEAAVAAVRSCLSGCGVPAH